MSWLLDGNVLLALSVRAHEMHEPAHRWFTHAGAFATCPITQGTLLRLFARVSGQTSLVLAWKALEGFVTHPRHSFWPADLSFLGIEHRGLQGGAQVTDAYLAALARHHGGKVATFDKAFSLLHPDVVVKIDAL